MAILILLVVPPRVDAAAAKVSPLASAPKAGWLAHLHPISGAPKTVATGDFGDSGAAAHWTAVAYVKKALVKNPKRSVALGHVACISTRLGKAQPLGTVCGSLKGLAQPAHALPGTALLTYEAEQKLGYLSGAVAAKVARVVLVLKSGVRVPVTLKTVSGITGGIRFFALQYQVNEIASIAIYDARGNLLKNVKVGLKPRPGGSG